MISPPPARDGFRATVNRQPVQISAAGYTAGGRRRVENQDCHLIDETRGLFLVADGMGGCQAGACAARLAVGLLADHPALTPTPRAGSAATRDAIRRAFHDTNRQMIVRGELEAHLRGMGTTAVLALRVHDRLYIASVGDSRAYLLRDGVLRQYTTDHNLAQTLVTLGVISPEAARDHPWRHRLWKHLGHTQWSEGPDLTAIYLQTGDRILLVTDGVTEALTDQDLESILNACHDPCTVAEVCVREAVSGGTRDDATAVILDVRAATPPVRGGPPR